MYVLNVLGWLLLVFLPGAWITFGLSLKGLPSWARLCFGAMLSPVVVAAQFYVLRLVGLSFETTSLVLVLGNAPAVLLIARRRGQWPRLDGRTAAAAALVAVVMLAATAPFMLDAQKRLYTWEAWSQADVVYALANGGLDLQDAELAGFRLSYPWAGHVYQAVQSYVLGSPPVDNFIWANLVWVGLIFAVAAGIVAEFGGNRLARVTAAVWLAFGVNFVGALGSGLIPQSWVRAHPMLGSIWGDNRYTPWLDKLVFFGQMWFALGLFIAIAFLSIRPWPTGAARRSYVVLTTLLLCALGIVYPVLLPAALTLVGARALVLIVRDLQRWSRALTWELLGISAGVLVAGLVTLGQVKFLTDGRASAGLIQLNDVRQIELTTIASIVVLSPLLVAFLYGLRRYWHERLVGTVVLGLAALASCAMYALFDIPWYRNEYKFIFTAAICLAPFPSLVLQAAFARLGRLALPAVAVLAAVLSVPLAHNIYVNTFTVYTRPGPLVDLQSFDLRLDAGESLAALSDEVRLATPVDSLLVADVADVHLPTLTRRQLYVPPTQSEPHPGILITSDQMLTLVKGYPSETVEARRATLNELFTSGEPAVIERALHTLLAFDRPLALVVDDQRNGALRDWLIAERIGTNLYAGNGRELWLIEPPQLARVPRGG